MQGDNEREERTPPAPASPPLKNPSRRRLARAGVAAPAVVLGTLASQPVLGSTTRYWCTISGKLSGNVSNHANELNCKSLGKAPDYWKTNSWPSPYVRGNLSNGACNFTGGSPAGTLFNGWNADGATLSAGFRMASVSGACKIIDATDPTFGAATKNATMLQVLYTGSGLNDTPIASLGRATVASLLNARQFGGQYGSYPLTESQIIAMFNAVYLGGTYQVNPTVQWTRDDVRTYFESLYGA
jgi:hypothetical protein